MDATESEKSLALDLKPKQHLQKYATSLKPKQYLQKHAIPEIIRSIVSGLMMETPDDHLSYIQEKLLECKKMEEKLDINWETFIHHLHPYRNEKRLELIHDYSSFYVEYLVKHGEAVPGTVTFDSAANAYDRSQMYRPQVFKLTETSPDPE